MLQNKEKGDMTMSFQNISKISTEIKINKEEVFNLLFASIAFEQLGLSRIINAEIQKLQYILDIFKNNQLLEMPTVEELIQINITARKIFRTVINNHILLQSKLDDILDLVIAKTITSTTINEPTSTSNTTSTIAHERVLCSPVLSCKEPASKSLSFSSVPLLHNNVNANRNISINGNSILLSRNSNVIKTTKVGLSININTSPSTTYEVSRGTSHVRNVLCIDRN